MLLLLPVHKQKIQHVQNTLWTVQCWALEHKSNLQDCLGSIDWSAFQDFSRNLDEYADSVMDYFRYGLVCVYCPLLPQEEAVGEQCCLVEPEGEKQCIHS